MMIYWQLFLAFLIPSLVGYGGGPAIIPLIQNEVVNHYGWLTLEQFGDVLALGNALPGPIATKMAGFIGYQVGGIFGAILTLIATIVPSLLAMIFLLGILQRFKDSPKVKNMTLLIRPTIGILLAIIAGQFFISSMKSIGMVQTLFITLISILLLERFKVHPAWVILGSLLYGFIVLV